MAIDTDILGARDEDVEFVRSMYLALLDREADPAGLKAYVSALKAGSLTQSSLRRALVSSAEFRSKNSVAESGLDVSDLRVFQGYTQADVEIFARFPTSHVQPWPGFLTEWIGSRVRLTSLWNSAVIDGVDASVRPLPVPFDFHASAVEWIGTLKAVLAANGSFSVMELGAGYGPWIAAACAAARALGIEDLHVCGVEADPGRFAHLEQNMADNWLTGSNTTLHCAAVGAVAGRASWPRLERPAEDAGARPLRAANEEDRLYFEGRGDSEFMDVDILALPELLAARPVWDLVHIDIQGTEDELCRECIGPLTERARHLVIGTHARWIDGDLMRTFMAADWVLEHEIPAKMEDRPRSRGDIALKADGVQVWRNPRL